ncbi:hypothetical protein KRX57_07720 [Weeksellaceae bacterium TAE3-ERU29]|nr:hypothetical protein [Weeksellaceae bacterium TAE3-ERU29]
MKSILNNLYYVFFWISVLILIFYTSLVTLGNIRYYNSYINGEVYEVITEYTDNPSAGASNYSYFVCAIKADKECYKSKIKTSVNIKRGDIVRCIRKSDKYVRILEINGKNVQNKYGIEDYLSFSILIILFSIISYLTYKNIKKQI